METYERFDGFIEYYKNWFHKIEQFVENENYSKDEIIITFELSPVGKWFYSEGKKEFGNLQKVIFLETKFIKLHNLVTYLYDAIIDKDQSLIDIYKDDFLVLSRRMIPNLELSRDYIIEVKDNTPVINLH